MNRNINLGSRTATVGLWGACAAFKGQKDKPAKLKSCFLNKKTL